MRPIGARRRVLESLNKAKALVKIEPNTRLENHALAEAVLHQIGATWVALLRQIGDSHGLKPKDIDDFPDLLKQLSDRSLVSIQAQKLQSLINDPSFWWSNYQKHLKTIECPDESQSMKTVNLIPLGDDAMLELIISNRYKIWVDGLSTLVDEYQIHFDES